MEKKLKLFFWFCHRLSGSVFIPIKVGIAPNLQALKGSIEVCMVDDNGNELPARKVNYLKYIYEHGGTAKTVDLAAHFSVDASTISKTITGLTSRGFLSHAPYQRITLSRQGKLYAGFFVKRHRILSLMLTHYGFSQEEACEEASRFESYVSKGAVDRICRTMGHPQEGACGSITHDTGCMGERTGPKNITKKQPVPDEKMRILR